MGIEVVLRDDSGRRVVLPDPAGGHFNAAGDFDRLVPDEAAELALLGSVDPYDDHAVYTRDVMTDLIAEVDLLLPVSRAGAERRGLVRLRVLATECLNMPGSVLVFVGD